MTACSRRITLVRALQKHGSALKALDVDALEQANTLLTQDYNKCHKSKAFMFRPQLYQYHGFKHTHSCVNDLVDTKKKPPSERDHVYKITNAHKHNVRFLQCCVAFLLWRAKLLKIKSLNVEIYK